MRQDIYIYIYIYNGKDDDPDKREPGVSFLGTYHS